jgi:hypothetical protein
MNEGYSSLSITLTALAPPKPDRDSLNYHVTSMEFFRVFILAASRALLLLNYIKLQSFIFTLVLPFSGGLGGK